MFEKVGVNTVSANFNTITGQMTEIFQRQKKQLLTSMHSHEKIMGENAVRPNIPRYYSPLHCFWCLTIKRSK